MRVSRGIEPAATAGDSKQGGDTNVSGAKTTEHTIFAAGDCCCLDWPMRESPHWFQMRLWSQARCDFITSILRVYLSEWHSSTASHERAPRHCLKPDASNMCSILESSRPCLPLSIPDVPDRLMGLYTAKCMTDCVDELGSGGAFDLFVHATEFFGHKASAALQGGFSAMLIDVFLFPIFEIDLIEAVDSCPISLV